MSKLLTQLVDNATSAEDLETLTRPLLGIVQIVSGLESAYLTMVDETRGLQHVLFATNRSDMEIPEGLAVPWHDTLCKRAMEEERPFTDDVPTCWADSEAAQKLGLRTYLSVPIHRLDGALFGTLCAASPSQRALPENAMAILRLCAELISRQVDREVTINQLITNNEQLIADSLTDPLTGAANRRALVRQLEKWLENGDHIELVFIDLDGFKKINDTYGHDAGDRFLIHIANHLFDIAGDDVLVARYGGDEFVLATLANPKSTLAQRASAATIGPFTTDRINFHYSGASMGSAHSNHDDTPESLIERADKAMYQEKQARIGKALE